MRTLCYRTMLFVFMTMCVLRTSATDWQLLERLTFKQQPSLDMLPSNEVQKVYQDRSGFIWIGTRNGLFRYDGYSVNDYKSNLYTPDLFTNNDILSIQEDNCSNLWIATQNGLNVMNLRTAEIRKYVYPTIPNNTVSCLLATKDGSVWIGTELGLCRYIAEQDSFLVYAALHTQNVMKKESIKSLWEDSDGDIWIGTWKNGLYRYCPSEDKFYAYPPLGSQDSPHVIFEDSDKHIWVGTWGDGLFQLQHPKDMARVSYINYQHHPTEKASPLDNIIYAIEEDCNTHSLWVGTGKGLSIMGLGRPGYFINYTPLDKTHRIPSDQINSIICDNNHTIWIGTIGSGVLTSTTREPLFRSYNIGIEGSATPPVRSLFSDVEGNIWMGIGMNGIMLKKKGTEKFQSYSQLPEFSDYSTMPPVHTIIQRKATHDVYLGTSNGIYIIPPKGKAYKREISGNVSLNSILVNVLYEDRSGSLWIGGRTALIREEGDKRSIFYTLHFEDGTVCLSPNVRDFVEDTIRREMWMATSNYGVIQITRSTENVDSLCFRHFSSYNHELTTNTVLCLYVDHVGRLWAGTEGGGLYLYDRKQDKFVAKNLVYNIPGDRIGSIKEDEYGNLWLGTNVGLVKLSAIERNPVVRIYTTNDGLLDNFLISRASCRAGDELLFGSYKGCNVFRPADIKDDAKENTPLVITDFKLFNRSFSSYPIETRKRLSDLTPNYTKGITLPYQYNNFSIEFAALTYRNPDANKYAYRLDGFDGQWQYVDAEHRVAYYNNLESGTYTFLLKAANENGIWQDEARRLTITVLPPFWATWWAYLIYALGLLTVVALIVRAVRKRMLLRNALHIKELEKAKIEELNHAKLQFFTNITHELLTPLTILSATVDELKLQAPAYGDLYSIMSYNIRRLIRLLQQILEFRKAETGNLKLRVSQGSLSNFVRNEVASFQPLIKKHQIHLSVSCQPEDITGYFDVDKVDKILYNLLSNAAKYNKAGGHIGVCLSYADEADHVMLSVKDDGMGIPKEKQKDLFRRFYEGDYRRFNTTGSGIGLSLAKDLVELHKGTITVNSDIGQGTEFRIMLPIARGYFSEDQIDDTAPLALKEESPEETESEAGTSVDDVSGKPLHTLLLVEDNEELLHVMVRLLRREYNIFTARNGKEAVPLLEQEDIDLTVSDIMMPEMDGIELCQYLKSHIEISHIPIILLTAKTKDEDRAEAYDVGADAYLTKPFSLPVLHARIRNLLKLREQTADNFKSQKVLEVKDLDYTSLDEDFLQRAIECVQRHLSDPDFDQTRFVEEMNTTRSTAFRKIKSLTGLTFPGFLRNIRMKAACRLLEEKQGIRIAELAYAVGYNEPRYFSVCFKKEMGMLPQEYMERFVQKEKR